MDSQYDADLCVQVVDNRYDADCDERWLFVDDKYDATVKVFWTDDQNDCDIKILFVDNKYDAGWKHGNPWQMRL